MSTYSIIQHLGMSIDGAAWKDGEFALLTAYFDDTGKRSDTRVVSLAGFVAPTEQWVHFDRNWSDVLRLPQFDLEYFHMKELRQAKGRFAKFANNPALRNDLFDRLQIVIGIRVAETFAGTVVMEAYNEMNRVYAIEEHIGPPANMASMLAIGKLMRWREDGDPNREIKIVCDQGMDGWGQLDDVVYSEFGFRLTPAPVKKTPGLQAADFVAWEQQRALTELLTGQAQSWGDVRPTFTQFLKRFSSGTGNNRRVNWFVADGDAILGVVEHMRIPKRQSDALEPPERASTPR